MAEVFGQDLGSAEGATSPIDALVLGTVNAPFRRAIDSETLASCLSGEEVAPWIAHVATLFTEVAPSLVLAFADEHRIDRSQVAQAYESVKALTGLERADWEAVLASVA